ncbi:MAG: Hint domain-containing protein [Rhodobacteraceae bacterium]|nr:Hint domain-containing protein [Paracoccaceae bacterium]
MSCFASGTLIATERGEIAVERLLVGDLVLTRDNGYQRITAVSIRRMSGQFLLDNPHLRPIFIKAGALAEDLPERDTMLSPNIRIPTIETSGRFLSRDVEQMVPLKHLIDHKGVQQVDTIGVNYVYIAFSQHEVVAANGVWIEAFNARDYSLKYACNAQRTELFEIFPGQKSRHPGHRRSGRG